MFGMSLSEVGVVLLLVLVVMGPEKIPEAARFMGKMLREVRKASNLLRDAVMLDDDRPSPIKPRPLTQPTNGTTVQEEPLRRDPDPKRDVRVVAMAKRREPAQLKEVALQAMSSGEHHREVYLHVPYDETI